jgi:lipid A 3-O-deacylase
MNKKSLIIGAAMVLAFAAVPAAAVDGYAIEVGTGDSTEMARVALQWDMKQRWFQTGDWHLGSYWNVGLGYWQRDGAPGQNKDLAEIAVTPVLRFQQNRLRGLYLEGGLGAHLLTRTQIGDKRLGTLFQFGSSVGVGLRFGDKGQYELGYQYQHLSNAGIKQPNDGINFNQIRFRYHY